MTHIICRATACVFWEHGICTSEEIEYEPDDGCLTYQDIGDLDIEEDEDEDFGWEDEVDTDPFDDEDDDWEDATDNAWEDDDDFDL
jgi:hypothetical protein